MDKHNRTGFFVQSAEQDILRTYNHTHTSQCLRILFLLAKARNASAFDVLIKEKGRVLNHLVRVYTVLNEEM